MDKAGSRQTIKLLLVLLGVVALVATYFLLRPELVEKTEALTAEAVKLADQLQELTELEANEATYVSRSAEYEKEIGELLEKFPPNILEEDVILYAVELSKKADLVISTIGMSQGNLVYSANTGGGTTDSDIGLLTESTAACPDYRLYSVSASYDFTAGYEDLKSTVARVLADGDKRNVPSISMTYDTESGLLVGNMSVNLYYMTGTDKIYEEPDAGKVNKGTDNIFGSM